MMRTAIRPVLLLVAVLLVPACGNDGGDTTVINQTLPTTAPAAGAILVVTDSNILLNVSPTNPSSIVSAIALTGLQPGEVIRGIDYRPAGGQLYALGSTSRLYQIRPETAICIEVGLPGAFTLTGTAFGFDFNPTVDRIRVVSNTDQNIRLNPNGALAATDITLAYAAGDANAAANPNVTGVAYSNNVNGATTTTLYGVDTNLNILVTQNPPNNGTLNTVGALGVAASGSADFDISASGTAYAAIPAGGMTSLYTINLSTGAATVIGVLASGGPIQGMAVVP
jgi:hypothetical protein